MVERYKNKNLGKWVHRKRNSFKVKRKMNKRSGTLQVTDVNIFTG